VLFGLCLLLAGYFSKNKYAALSSIRCGLLMANLEILLGLLLLNVVLIGESFTLSAYVVYQESLWLAGAFANMAAAILITFLLEVSRTPFDLAEAESELVAGYSTEYGGFYFALFYLGEYFHLFFFSLVISTLFLGG
jgi:NADH-quinone oxidoreductase subunit H